MKKVCRLALIELTALYDVLGVELKQQKAVKIKTKGNFEIKNKTVGFSSKVAKMNLASLQYSQRGKHKHLNISKIHILKYCLQNFVTLEPCATLQTIENKEIIKYLIALEGNSELRNFFFFLNRGILNAVSF